MFKTTLKSVAAALAILAAIIIVLTAVDGARNVSALSDNTYLRITVTDLTGAPVHNASVTVGEQSFFTDNKGLSPSIRLEKVSNCYDADIADWGTVTVQVTAEGYTPCFVFNCVVYRSATRHLNVKIYPDDGSNLPYVSYVEAPPDEYIKNILRNSTAETGK